MFGSPTGEALGRTYGKVIDQSRGRSRDRSIALATHESITTDTFLHTSSLHFLRRTAVFMFGRNYVTSLTAPQPRANQPTYRRVQDAILVPGLTRSTGSSSRC
jgi:hypothetical protein